MRGPEHYRAAERLLARTSRGDSDVAAAQVHATLALAAATALSAGTSYHAVQADMTEWRHAAGNETAAEREQMGDQP